MQELLSEALAAEPGCAQRLVDLVSSEYVVGIGLVEPVRQVLGAMAPDELARHLIGGLTVGEAGLDLGRLKKSSLIAAAVDDEACSSCRRCPTRCSCATLRAGSTAAYRSTRCTGRLAVARRSTWRPSTEAHPMFTGQDFEFWYPPLGDDDRFQAHDFGLASLEGGDVEIIGNGTVAIGLSERTSARMIEQIARALFAKGAADRVIAAVMTKDRAHMHLDTVFTLLDRDKVTAYPKVVDGIRSISLRPGSKPGTVDVREDKDLLSAVAEALGVKKLHVVETGGDATSRSASSGTTATTSSRSSPVWSLPTSATRSPSRRCARPESRSSRSRGSSSARAAAAGTA